jgi:hypothetical protein
MNMELTTENITALTLPDPIEFTAKMKAIVQFQRIVREQLVEGQDYGTFPGIDKPTLFKPGAEKIAKLLELADVYITEDKVEIWTGNGFFHYKIKAQLIHIGSGKLISEGLGECNSMESKYRYRWVSVSKLPANVDATKLVSEVRKGKGGKGEWTAYRLDNEDIFSQVNTILKMAKKRALVDAALSAGRLSQLFTQDVEDLFANKVIDSESTQPQQLEHTVGDHYCPIHNTKFFKSANMKGYAHPYYENGAKKWCNEGKQETESSAPAIEAQEESVIDMTWLKESLEKLNWADCGKWLKDKYHVSGKSVSEMVKNLIPEQQKEFAKEVEDRLAMN